MNYKFKSLLVIALTSSLFSCVENDKIENSDFTKSTTPVSSEGRIIQNQYIFTLKSSVISSARDRFVWQAGMTRATKGAAMEQLNEQIYQELDQWLLRNNIPQTAIVAKYATTFVGFAANLSPEKYRELQANNDFATIENDRIEEIPDHIVENQLLRENQNVILAQTTPCGITNAGGAATTVDTNRWVWVIDSGIDLDHPDLNVVTNTTYAKTFVSGTSNADDGNGHGTHVAGTIGAKNNTIGVIGVVPNAPVVPVRVFGASGGSATSVIVSGINHVATYDAPGDVVNMSLGGYYGSGCSTGSAYLSAINSLATTSRIAIAAGNDAANAALYQPACINGTNIFTVASMTCSKTFSSSFSNFGSAPIDWIATGSSVYSTYKDGGYATLSGTSMATPHVAGIMHARNAAPAQNGSVSYSGVSYKIAVR